MAETVDQINRITDPEWHRVFQPERGWRPGDVIQLPDLAKTLSRVADEGIGYLYGGELGQKLARHLETVGGVIGLRDLESVEPSLETPISAAYRDLQVRSATTTESFQFLLALKILDV